MDYHIFFDPVATPIAVAAIATIAAIAGIVCARRAIATPGGK